MLGYVDAVTDGAVTPAVTPLRVPAFYEDGVALLADADAVMLDSLDADAVTLDALYVEGVSMDLGDLDVLCGAAAAEQQDAQKDERDLFHSSLLLYPESSAGVNKKSQPVGLTLLKYLCFTYLYP